MSKRVKKHGELLKFLSHCKHHTAKSVLNSASPDVLNCISEVCLNILKGRVAVTPKQKSSLVRYKNIIRQLAQKKTSHTKKRKLIQKGGFVGVLGKILANLLPSITSTLFSK